MRIPQLLPHPCSAHKRAQDGRRYVFNVDCSDVLADLPRGATPARAEPGRQGPQQPSWFSPTHVVSLSMVLCFSSPLQPPRVESPRDSRPAARCFAADLGWRYVREPTQDAQRVPVAPAGATGTGVRGCAGFFRPAAAENPFSLEGCDSSSGVVTSLGGKPSSIVRGRDPVPNDTGPRQQEGQSVLVS